MSDNQDVLDIAGLLHSKWAECFNNLKAVKNERNDGSPDWDDFHETRLKAATRDESYWYSLKTRYQTLHQEVFNAMFGNS
jgi:hypothetical protein